MTHYETVGVKPDASQDEIKKAYKSRAQKLHPDKSEGDTTDEFQELNHAYSVISDPERRSVYDETGNDEKLKNYMAEATVNLGQIFLRIISEERKGDIVEMVTTEIKKSIDQAKQNRGKVDQLVVKFELLHGRVISKSDNNVCDNILDQQIEGLNRQIKQFDDFIKVGDLMIILLEDYSDSKPDLIDFETSNQWSNVTTHHIGIVSRRVQP